MAIGDVWEFRTYYTMGTQSMVNVLHARISAVVGTEKTPAQVAPFFSIDWAPLIKPLLADQTIFQGVQVRKVWPTATASVADGSANGPGTATGAPLPTQTCPIITLRSSFAPPRTRGRIFLPSASNTFVGTDGQTVTAGGLTVMNGIGNFLIATWNAGGGANITSFWWVIWKRGTATNHPMDSFLPRSKFATHRSRSQLNRGDV